MEKDGKKATLKTELRLRLDPEDSTEWELTKERTIDEDTWKRYKGYMAEIFSSFGMDLHTPRTERTPERLLRSLLESTAGYEGDPKLLTAFPTECRGGPGLSH